MYIDNLKGQRIDIGNAASKIPAAMQIANF